jgi:DNA polymerase-1
VNFGVLYGMTAPALAARMGCRVDQAESVMRALFGKFHKLKVWIDRCLASARRDGFAMTWWDGRAARRRDLWAIGEADDGLRLTAENSSWNTPVQGTASDFCLRSVVGIHRWLYEDAVPARLLLTVHDSVILSVRPDALEEVAVNVRRIMMSHNSMGVPLEVDFEVGPNWGQMTKYEEPQRVTLRAAGVDPNQAHGA